jgi:oligopeptidase A
MSDLELQFDGLTPDDIRRVCGEAMDACTAAIEAIAAIPAPERTFENTVIAMESASDIVGQVSGQRAFLAYVSADDELRAAAHEQDQALDQYSVALSFREDLYEALREYSLTGEAKTLTGERERLLEHTLRDYRRIGFELRKEDRAEVQELFNQLVQLGTEFRQNIDEWEDAIVVPREGLKGLPDAFIGALKTEDVDGETRYRVSLDYPEIQPFMSNAESDDLRKQLFEKDQRKGGDANVALLEKAIGIRADIATRLGYDSWASYVVETRMSSERSRVTDFLTELRGKVTLKAKADMELLSSAKQAVGGSGSVEIWDWRYHHNELLKSEFAVDEFEVAKYFPLDACLDGLFAVTQKLLGLRYEARPEAEAWHEDVKAFDVFEAEGEEPFARFFMDLFPRPNKYGHAAAFTMRSGRELADGSYQRPMSAIVANFTKPTDDSPSLLRHSEVITFFHEFGHILHQTLTRTKLLRFSGSATERDFVEAPSQMLEHWVWDKDILRSFSRHYESGEPLPDDLLDAMIQAKNLSSGVLTLRQLYFANLDFAYHSPGFDGDTTAVAKRLHEITGFPFPPGTHFQSGFGHLFGYDAGYYGYLWSHVFGDDMCTRFDEAGLLDEATGADYRRAILERGGSVDGDELVRSFLGREPNNEAFLRGLGLNLETV